MRPSTSLSRASRLSFMRCWRRGLLVREEKAEDGDIDMESYRGRELPVGDQPGEVRCNDPEERGRRGGGGSMEPSSLRRGEGTCQREMLLACG
jgi:hypothetical protein